MRKSLDDFIGECDVKITNLETNLSDFGNFPNQYSGGTWLNTRKELFKYLKSFEFNFYGTANNHCMDYSYAGLVSTIDVLDKNGCAHAGTGKSLDDAEKPAEIKLKKMKPWQFSPLTLRWNYRQWQAGKVKFFTCRRKFPATRNRV